MMSWLNNLCDFGAFWIFTYTPLQVLGALTIIAIAMSVIMFFTTLWSVDLVRNEGPEIDLMEREDNLFENSVRGLPPRILRATIERGDRDTLVVDHTRILINKVRYSYDLMYLQIMMFSVGDRHYILDRILDQRIESDQNRIIMAGEFSCSASLREDVVDSPYIVTFEYEVDRKSMNLMYRTELDRVYRETNFRYLISDAQPDGISRSLNRIRDRIPDPIDEQASVRSLFFVAFYKLMDPGFRSIGLDAIQNFMILMNLHILVLRVRNLALLLDFDPNSSKDNFNNDIVNIEDGIRRFIAKFVTSKKRQTAINDILNRYIRLLRVQSSEQSSKQSFTDRDEITQCLDRDLWIMSISARMYAEILVELADPDSRLYTEDLIRLYALVVPLIFLRLSNNQIHSAVDDPNDEYLILINRLIRDIDSCTFEEKPHTLLEIFGSNDDLHQNENYHINDLDQAIQKVYKLYGLKKRALNTEGKDIYALLRS